MGSSVTMGDLPRGNMAFKSWAVVELRREKFLRLYFRPLVAVTSSSAHRIAVPCEEERL